MGALGAYFLGARPPLFRQSSMVLNSVKFLVDL